ncbi:TIGR03943 family putative permease subunit [Myxacorys almedinensis]|uniref:TIGR03943 family protein n=1 Tax=Myxacorys almedinensis A TaxID=2690445 RepID=A0A8J7Z5T8_9CYAN|nr:TIGR03943 family protein [Myxacorys almedinensis]NDJ18623.1 TIGR03943 family protein [Myxacorys almedinensis A]
MARLSFRSFLPWLDVLAIAAWGIVLLKFWLTGQLFLLIHPNYNWLTIAAAFTLLLVSGLKAFFIWRASQRLGRQSSPPMQHVSLFPPGWGSALMLGMAIAGLVFTPQAFASQTALDRGLTDTLTSTRVNPQAFRSSTRSEDKNLIDWIRSLQVYPEPDAYTGQKAKVQGFVVYPPNLSEQYFLLTRFVITCCAADVYPISLPVKLAGGDSKTGLPAANRQTYAADSWVEVEGQMITETLDGRRQLTIQATALKPVPTPKNPYDY